MKYLFIGGYADGRRIEILGEAPEQFVVPEYRGEAYNHYYQRVCIRLGACGDIVVYIPHGVFPGVGEIVADLVAGYRLPKEN